MPRVTRHGPSRPITSAGTIGYDPGEALSEAESPVDHADDAAWTIPVTGEGDVAFVQSKVGTNSSSSISVTLDGAPGIGNLLVAVMTERSAVGTVSLSGWTAYPDTSGIEYTGFAAGKAFIFYKIAGVSESAIVTVGATSGHDLRLMVAEFSGSPTFDSAIETSGTGSSVTSGTLTPTASISAIQVGVILQHSTSFAIGGGFTEISQGYVAGGFTPYTGFGYRLDDPTSGSYAMTATSSQSGDYAGVTLAFAATPVDVLYVSAVNVKDGSDATFDYVTDAYITSASGVIFRGTLALDYVLASAILRIGMESAGSTTIRVEGSTSSTFASVTTLDTQTFTALGSFTAQDVAFTFPATTGYTYIQFILTTAAQDVRVYEVELYGPPEASTTIAAHLADTADSHDASAISVLDTGGYYTATAVEGVLAEIGPLVGGTLRWEAVTNGEDVFVWSGDDLVHEYKEY